MKIGIGTAQLGMKYGIANKSSKITLNNFEKILNYSLKKKIFLIDTANTYGNSEDKIGALFSKNKKFTKFKVITKLNSLRKFDNKNIYPKILKLITLSIKKMNVKKLDGVLLHDMNDLKSYKSEKIIQTLYEIKKKGLISKLGISAYDIRDVLKYTKKFNFDFIQFPLNIFDQRILDKKILKKLKDRKIEIHIRSIFLQGLLLMSKNNLPNKFKSNVNLKKWYEFLLKNNISALEACTDFIKSKKIYSKAIIGFDNYKQFLEFLKYFSNKKKLNLSYKDFSVKNFKLINPSKWN
ncbi:aldo/keto reductase [Candidatus Pelagibacter sp.]|jgi:aryl-alcohol dehydrogenase-like predicted oxidoreductase|nr:aldo/keto reductase [Candidatus Pelagibacter sp.]